MTELVHVNPPGLHTSPAFSQGARAGSLLFVGGQNGADPDGAIVGDVAVQTERALRNVRSG